jgi:cytochrome c5
MGFVFPRLVPAAVLVLVAAIGASVRPPEVHAQAPATTQDELRIWQGAFTAAQAERGQKMYEAYCTRCHGLNLLGGRQGAGGGPALKDANFWLNWERAPLASLYSKISRTMPLDSPASLRDDDYQDLLAFMLRENDFPAGSTELTAAALDAYRIVKKDGTVSEAPDFALVQVVGCLTEGADGAWMLTRSTAPLVTRDEVGGSASLSDAANRPLGSGMLRLIGVRHLAQLETQAGQRVEARGLINRVPGDERLDVLSLQTVRPDCG